MACVNSKGRPWIISNATIAFPNDRPLTLRPRETDTTAKTIFKGLERYRPPVDESMTYTMENFLKKQSHDFKFLEFIRCSAALSLIRHPSVIKKECCKQHPVNPAEPNPLVVFNKDEAKPPQDVLAPLTFIQLYRIKIYPTLLSFGNVTTNKISNQFLTIDNQNSFKISVKIQPLSSNIQTPMKDDFTILEKSKMKVMLSFFREKLGRFSSTITCVINGQHCLDISVVAEVVPISLTLDPDCINMTIQNVPFALSFLPLSVQNTLNTPVSFSWSVPDGSPFKIEPTLGVVLQSGSVWCAAYFEPDCPNYKLYSLKLMVEGVVIHKVKCNMGLPKPNVHFLEPVLNVGHIPQRLSTRKRCAVFNPEFYDAMFVILNKHPIDGVSVEPLSGNIKARSCFGLVLHFNVPNEGLINFVLYMNILDMITIELKVTGVVVSPQVEISPKNVKLTRLPCNSVTRTTLVAENKGIARAKLSINMEDYPQFKVSLSKRQHDSELASSGYSLNPGAVLRFYLYFMPKDLAWYEFYLPVVVNSFCVTQKYSGSSERPSESSAGVQREDVLVQPPSKLSLPNQKKLNLPVVQIDVKVVKPILEFSDLEISFTSTSETKIFTTKNVSDEHIHVMFRCEDVQPAFSFEVNKCFITKEGSKIIIPPGCKVPITVVFTASSHGTFQTDLSIQVVEDDQCSIYNTLRVSGSINALCEIHPSINNIYLPPVPLNVKTCFIFNLSVTNINNTKEVKLKYEISKPDEEMFTIEFLKGNSVPGLSSVDVPVKVTFRSTYATSLRTLITFSSSEVRHCSLAVVATADNSLLTVHTYLSNHFSTATHLREAENPGPESCGFMKSGCNILQSNQQMRSESIQSSRSEFECMMVESEKTSFPKFPMGPVVSEYAIHMNQTLNAVQQWMYEQVFSCSYFPVLGSHLFSTISPPTKKYRQNSNLPTKNVFDALERICGRQIRRFFTSFDKCPEENTAKVMFTHNIYKQLLEFMNTQGALLAHVEPKYLMSFDDYCHYIENGECCNSKQEKKDLLNQETFKSISIQCWLDLFLQIYRTLVLPSAVSFRNVTTDQETFLQKLFPQEPSQRRGSKSCRAEVILLNWLTKHFNEQFAKLEPQETPELRNVTNFHHDLQDGLVLTTVTMAFCPFLVPIHFQNMFTEPTTVSQAYHNTICLTKAWVHIRLGFSVTPKDFMHPNPVKMLMLVTHLYKILPTYKAETKIAFSAMLNTSEVHVITLDNIEKSPCPPITYHIEIIPNNTYFDLDNCKNSIVLKHKQEGQIPVRFTARSTTKVDATLLLCGACLPPKFGRNHVFTLEGCPTKLPVSSIFNLVSPLNTPMTRTISIECPHKQVSKNNDPTEYDILITCTEPQPGSLKTLSWEIERQRKLPQRLFILSEKLVVETVNKRVRAGKLALQVCCFSHTPTSKWLVFTNKDFGDFIVQLIIKPGTPEPSSTLTVYVDSKKPCSCRIDRMIPCDRIFSVNIPCRNLDQLAAIKTMFELTIPPTEKEFWATCMESNVRLRLLQWMLEEQNETLSEEIEQMFQKSKSYKVNCQSSHVSCTQLLNIPDVKANSTMPFELHFDSNTRSQTTLLTLTSSDGLEIRCYTLNVICKE